MLHPSQYGFRQNLSTTHAMLDMMNKTSVNISSNKTTELVFLEFTKVLIRFPMKYYYKLDRYGVRGNVNSLYSISILPH